LQFATNLAASATAWTTLDNPITATNTTSTAYDPGGRVTQSINPMSETITTAYDDAGRVTAVTVPITSTMTFQTVPSGLQLSVDSIPGTAPFSIWGVAGFQRLVNASSPQTLNGQNYQFVSWSDGGALSHTLTTPNTNMSFTATFQPVASTPCDVNNDGSTNVSDVQMAVNQDQNEVPGLAKKGF